jgi:hypothetical protein
VAASRQLHDGVPPVPVAFASSSVDFVISLKDAPHILIHLRGEDVSLFDVGRGRCAERLTFGAAPERWQDFVVTHRAAAPGIDWQTSSQLSADGATLDFQECALLIGGLATFVGELHRGADGTLYLRPLQSDNISTDTSGTPRRRSLTERWRTSWERGGCEAALTTPHEGKEKSKAHFEKVLASDDIHLLECCSDSLLGSAAALFRRLQTRCRTLAFLHTRHHRAMASEKL